MIPFSFRVSMFDSLLRPGRQAASRTDNTIKISPIISMILAPFWLLVLFL
jgi:hypothetical protein